MLQCCVRNLIWGLFGGNGPGDGHVEEWRTNMMFEQASVSDVVSVGAKPEMDAVIVFSFFSGSRCQTCEGPGCRSSPSSTRLLRNCQAMTITTDQRATFFARTDPVVQHDDHSQTARARAGARTSPSPWALADQSSKRFWIGTWKLTRVWMIFQDPTVGFSISARTLGAAARLHRTLLHEQAARILNPSMTIAFVGSRFGRAPQ